MAYVGQVIEDDIQITTLILTHVGQAIADGVKILGHQFTYISGIEIFP